MKRMNLELPFLTDGKTDTSREAGESMEIHVSRLEGIVLDAILAAGLYGACCFELEEQLGLSHQTASARITGLQIKDKVWNSGLKRPTRSNRQAIVWWARREG